MFNIPSLALRIKLRVRVRVWGNTWGTRCPQLLFHTLSKYANPRVWVRTVGQHALPVQPTAPSPHALKKKKTHSLTLLLQNHLDHFNILLQDLWHWHVHDLLTRVVYHGKYVHVHPCCRLSPVRALQTTSPATSSTISSMNHSTGTFTICSQICSLMTLGMTVRNGHQHHVNQMTTCESHDNLQFPSPKDITTASGPTK